MSLHKDPTTGQYIFKPTAITVPAVATGMGFAPEIGGTETFGGLETLGELTSGSVVSVGVFTFVMSWLDTIPMRRAEEMTAAEQRAFILDRTWQATKNSVPMVIILASVLCIFPFLGPVVGIGGVVGVAFASSRLTRGIIDALSDEQREAIKVKAEEVKQSIPGITTQEVA